MTINKKDASESAINLPEAALVLLENSFESVIIADSTKEHLIQYVNPAWEKITGWKKDEVVGKANPRILKSGKQSAEFYKTMWNTILAGKIFHSEIINKRKDGTFYTAEISILPIMLKGGGDGIFAEIGRDITEQKKAQEKIKKMQAEETEKLTRMVEEKTKELKNKVSELERLNRLMVGRELKMAELKEEIKRLGGKGGGLLKMLKSMHQSKKNLKKSAKRRNSAR